VAISLKATGSWAEVTADAAITIPGSPAAGDRMFLFATWKAFSVTAQVTSPQAWTEVTEFADGSVASGANVGSVKVGCWFRDWQSGDGNPTLDLSAGVIGAAVVQVWQKDAAETWETPSFVTAAISANTNWSATSSSTLTVADGAVVFELTGFRDDSSTMTRSSTTALEDDGSPNVTWNGNVVESPATHFSTTNGNDISADLIHRFVTTGAAGVNLTGTGTLAASETGAALWVHQHVTASGNITVTPTTAALTLATFAPTATLSDHQTVVPSTAALVTSAFAPTVATSDHQTVTPTTTALTTSTFAPTVALSDHQTVVPDVAALVLTPFAPNVQAGAGLTVVPTTASLAITAFAPTVSFTEHQTVTPTTASLALMAFAPDTVLTDHQLVTPATRALALTAFAPNVVASDHKLLTPSTAALVTTGFAPLVSVELPNPIALPVFVSISVPGLKVGSVRSPDRYSVEID
jgi:hypothetical protein